VREGEGKREREREREEDLDRDRGNIEGYACMEWIFRVRWRGHEMPRWRG